MNKMEKVTYIVPIHQFATTKDYLAKAFTSLSKLDGAGKFEVLLVGNLEDVMESKKLYSETCPESKQIITMVPTDISDLFEKINFAVTKVTTKYFSVLEIDDEFYPYWNIVAQDYLSNVKYSIIMPMVDIMLSDGKIVGLANEIAWDASFAGEEKLGFLNLNDLLIFKDFITSGAYINKDDFLQLAGLKPELKIAAWYEYLLNTANSGKTIFVAPRVGYKHTILREGSYMTEISKEISQEEGMKLIEEATKAYQTEEKTDE